MLNTGRPSKEKSQKETSIESVKKIDTPAIKLKRFNADIPESLHTALKIQAAKEGIKLNELATSAFNDYLSKNSKK